ncbi:MAG: tRNA (adenosine(37)-N6)-threonylcarbamoyltransferase complex ATPase subunit type 1 TsaE [Xanthomonadales bacterium]|nr:tRNA (adenosine(37)-N6)-threonylcarbamoyltransferase complex ATPase subunit type 1 TsaE [Xanthomonadales bacterium]
MNLRVDLPDLSATDALGARLARALQAPLVIGLIGDLGAGKTALVRALIQSLPTYTLIESYELGALLVHHLDLYRLRHPEELTELGLADVLGPESVMLIEWPDKGGEETPTLDLAIHLFRLGDDARRAEFDARTEAGRRFCERVAR